MNISVIGSIFVDHKAYPYGKFIPDGRNSGYEIQVHGGVGRNIAQNLSHIGIDTNLVSLADDNGGGEDVISALYKSRVGTQFIKKTKSGMGKWIAVFNENGDVAASISVRPELEKIADIIEDNHEAIFGTSDGIILEADIDEEAVRKTFLYARKYGVKVYCVVSVMKVLLEQIHLLDGAECFVCNLQEAEMMFGTSLEQMSESELSKYISSNIAKTGFNMLIVTLGERGAVYCDRSGNFGSCPAEDANLVDSTGAGDAFASGAFAALIGGKSLGEACRIGAVTAANVISDKKNVCTDFKCDKFGLNKLGDNS